MKQAPTMRKIREFSADVEYVPHPTHLEPVMPGNGEFAKWRNHLFWVCASAVMTGAAAWCGWVTMSVVDQGRIEQQLASIVERMQEVKEDRQHIIQVVQKNTEAINALKVQIALLQGVVERRIPPANN